jgi:ATP-binding cassette subfamily B protein
MNMIKKLAASVREFKKDAILSPILIIGEVIMECIMPFIIALLVDEIEDGASLPTVLKYGGILVLMAVVSLICGTLAARVSARASTGFARNLRGDIFNKVQTYSFENIDKFSTSSLVTRLTTDVSNVQMAFMMIIRIAIRAPFMLVFSIIMAYVMGGALATAFVVIIPFLAFGLFLVSRKAMPAFRAVFKKYDKLNESIEENVRAMRVVKGFSREEYEKEKFGSAAENIRADFTKAERIVALNSPLMQICVYSNMIFVMLMGSKIIIQSAGLTIGVGAMSAMLTYGMQILMQLMMLSMIYVMLTMSVESAKRICEVLDEVPVINNPEAPITEIKDGSVEFDNVTFRYAKTSERPALDSINIKIESGMTVGVLGGTGSGKSSLVQLIPRLYDVSEGRVTVGGKDVREYDITLLRDSVAMVLQKNLLFSGTIKENLRWGNENASDEELQRACERAQAHEFISSFPDGYDTYIEQGGTNVSGGQKQRLCIARALIKNPKILILDDSTSAVDTKTDAFIRAGLASYIPDTTKIIIAQRVASVMEADMIIVMDGGKISAYGDHKTLLSTCEIYREIYEQQIGGGENNE